MSPSANGQKSALTQRVYIVERRAEFRELNSQIDPNHQQPYEPEISYLDDAYLDERQAYAAAIREQILELDESCADGTHNGRKIAAQTTMSLKDRLRSIHKEVDVAAETHEDPEAPVVKFGVLEFPLVPVLPFHESEFLSTLEFQSESEDAEAEDEEDDEEGDEEEEEEADDGEEGEEGVEEVEGEEDQEDQEDDDIEDEGDDDDDGEEVDDDEDDAGAAPQSKKQKT